MKNIYLIGMCLLLIGLARAEHDWVSSYYLNPAPEDFVKEVKAIAESGELDKADLHPSLIGFLSQVMAQNPKKVDTWLTQLEDLKEKDRTTLLVAAWFSDTQGARDYFTQRGLNEYLQSKPKSILEMKIQTPESLDLLWGYFFARGDEASIRHIVTAFDLAKYEGSLDRYKYENQSLEAQQAAYLEATFQAAVWSVESNCKQHSRVLEYCEKIFTAQDLSKAQREQLGKILVRVKPEQYRLEDGRVIAVGAVSKIRD
ncbi:hypothetical protein Rhal01_01860 [Rubritalea halochordaticola]|uniref:Uncharacterized protein n=1 Tax=Rubritalea halochordaticola TaxID=714537 RepID=A0ABP9V3M3_9BACT